VTVRDDHVQPRAHGPEDPLVPATATDRYFDYCLQPYEPRGSWEGKLRGESLLWHSVAVARANSTVVDAFHGVQKQAGRDATVWGAKHIGGRLSWELYFYDPQKADPRVRATDVMAALSPWMRCTAPLWENAPYFMFSFDVPADLAVGHEVVSLNYYLAEPVGQAGRSYKAARERAELDNVYHFLRPKQDVREVLYRIRSSVFVDWSKVDVAKVLFPELITCNRICVAKKRTADAVYYSGIRIEQLIWFLRHFGYPAPIVDFATEHRQRFEHLLFDVGIDYRQTAGGTIETPKSSYYSTL
jgi:hypothetical protein